MLSESTDIEKLTAALHSSADAELTFFLDDVTIHPGYHVTEIRHASINSVDCGKNSGIEQWDELTIQLLDGSKTSTQGHMKASKFKSILQKSSELLHVNNSPVLFFEFSPNNGPIRKLSIQSISQTDSSVSVILGSEKAVCKPFQKAKAAHAAVLISSSEPNTASSGGCCSSSTGCC